jgi:dehydrogenase/reductase SDR family protein 12
MTFYRNVVWFIKGMREYTKSGFESAAKRFVATDLDVDCSGKSFMITGANSGLGKQVRILVQSRN